MIVFSGTSYRHNANLLRSMIQDWCIQHNKILDTQQSFNPGRSNSQPLFILQHSKHAAQKVQSGSSRLYPVLNIIKVKSIDFKQAYKCISRTVLQDTSCGAIYGVARCPTISCPS